MTRRSDYYDMMHRASEDEVAGELEKRYGKTERESTFKKPYYDDSYQEMEEFYYPYDGFDIRLPSTRINQYIDDYPGRDTDAAGGGCDYCIITCNGALAHKECDQNVTKGECHTNVSCFVEGGSSLDYNWCISGDPIKEIKYFKTAIGTGEIGGGGSSIEIYPDWSTIELINEVKEAKYTVTLTDGLGHKCSDSLKIECKEVCCPAEVTFAYSDDSDDTIDREGTANVIITGGCTSYSWSVSGTGFSFANATTLARVNTLIADETACGTASITVTDDCGTTVTGEVRCTEGEWVIQGYANWSGLPDAAKCVAQGSAAGCDATTVEEIVGGERWKIWNHTCLGHALGLGDPCTGIEDITWVKESGYLDIFVDPPCGSPHSCAPGSCTGGSPDCSGRWCYGCVMVGNCIYYKWSCPE